MKDFKKDLNQRYWQYQKTKFPEWQNYFERRCAEDERPPVFLSDNAWRNIIINPNAKQREIDQLLSLIPKSEHHRWYRSMNSSQALTHSVFGNLSILDSLNILEELKDTNGRQIFEGVKISPENFIMEHKVNYLGEPRQTSLDGFISGDYRIAIECKFTETEVGSCSRPRLTPNDSNCSRDFCNGTFTKQRSRINRCSLTEIGVRYWDYVPKLFKWNSTSDLDPCPLLKNYQLVRNILAVGLKPDGTISSENGHVVLIYDERNLAFQVGGKGWLAFNETKEALYDPEMLRKCSWQCIVKQLRRSELFPWLTDHLQLKYGFL